MQVVWTRHAQERQQQWEQRLGITCEEVEAVLINPLLIPKEDKGDKEEYLYRYLGYLLSTLSPPSPLLNY